MTITKSILDLGRDLNGALRQEPVVYVATDNPEKPYEVQPATTVDQLATHILNSGRMDEQKLVALLDAAVEEKKEEQEQKARIAARSERLRVKFGHISIREVIEVLKKNRKRDGEGKMYYAAMKVETIAKHVNVSPEHFSFIGDFVAYIDRVLRKHESLGQHIRPVYGCRGRGDYYGYVSSEVIAYEARKRSLKAEGELVVTTLRERLLITPSERGTDYYTTTGGRKLWVEIDSFYSAKEDRIEFSVNFLGGFTFNDVPALKIEELVRMTAAFYDAAQTLIGK